MDIQELSRTFGSETVSFRLGPGNFIYLDIRNAKSSASICTYGAHIVDFTPAGERPVLWMGGHSWFEKGKPIRGGVPVCWPWFGPLQDPAMPAHGFARLSQWRVKSVGELDCGATRVVLALNTADVEAVKPAFAFDLEMEFVIGRSLQLRLTSTNRSGEEQEIADALHTYLSVAESAEISVRGLDSVEYMDRVVGAPVVDGLVQKGDIRIDCEVDRVYLGTTAAVEVVDPGFGRTIRVEKSGSSETVIWNPWIRKSHAMPDFGDEEYHGMICVEAVNFIRDRRILAPGASHVLGQKITVL